MDCSYSYDWFQVHLCRWVLCNWISPTSATTDHPSMSSIQFSTNYCNWILGWCWRCSKESKWCQLATATKHCIVLCSCPSFSYKLKSHLHFMLRNSSYHVDLLFTVKKNLCIQLFTCNYRIDVSKIN